MIKVYPYENLGRADFGWLQACYHFSFSRYYNPERTGFGALRVINDDIVRAGAGFDTHPHSDMEIITFIRKGAITHRDSRGNEGRTQAGDVQVMSAGTGIAHSEHNHENVDTSLFQIWIEPREKGVTPRWETAPFSSRAAANGLLPLLVSGRKEDEGKGALYIHQEASIHGGKIKAGEAIDQPIRDQAYFLVSEGEVEVDGQTLRRGDGAEITQLKSIRIRALDDSEVIVIDVPA